MRFIRHSSLNAQGKIVPGEFLESPKSTPNKRTPSKNSRKNRNRANSNNSNNRSFSFELTPITKPRVTRDDLKVSSRPRYKRKSLNTSYSVDDLTKIDSPVEQSVQRSRMSDFRNRMRNIFEKVQNFKK